MFGLLSQSAYSPDQVTRIIWPKNFLTALKKPHRRD